MHNITHEKRTVRIALMSPLFVSTLFQPGRVLFSGHCADERNPLVSRFAPRKGLVTLRQTFVRRCQWWANCTVRRINYEQWHRFSPEFCRDLALKYREAALGDMSQLRTRVENAIASVLPHGRVLVEDIARSLRMSERTLARKLSGGPNLIRPAT
jgi:hypothetical protein